MDRCIKRIIATFVLIIWIRKTYGLGNDYGSVSANLIILSLVNVEECNIPQQTVNSIKVYIQLLQLNDFKALKIIQCKLEINRSIRRCETFFHTLDVHNEQFSYIADVSRETCQRIFMKLRNSRHSYNRIDIKSDSFVPDSFSYVDHDEACIGGAYSDPYRT